MCETYCFFLKWARIDAMLDVLQFHYIYVEGITRLFDKYLFYIKYVDQVKKGFMYQVCLFLNE